MQTDDQAVAFSSEVLVAAGRAFLFARVPAELSKSHLRRGRITARVAVGASSFDARMEPDGQLGHWFVIPSDVRTREGLEAGRSSTFVLSTLKRQPEPVLPGWFRQLLGKSAAAQATWDRTTTLARIDWVHWMESAKLDATKKERAASAIDMLEQGKKRVCCFDPSGFYSKALACPVEADEQAQSDVPAPARTRSDRSRRDGNGRSVHASGVMNMPRVTFSARLERKHPKLPVYVVVPAPTALALGLRTTTVVEGAVNGHLFGRRTIKRWDASEHSPWFVELTTRFCAQAGVGVGDELDLALWLADPALPEELATALDQSRALRAAWDQLSDYTRRASAEHVHAAKSRATRARRTAAIVASLTQGGSTRSHDA